MIAPKKTSASETVRRTWTDAPAWVTVLAAHCDASSQRTVAAKVGRSAALVNQVLKNAYKGNLTSIQKLVESTYLQPNATTSAASEKASAADMARASWKKLPDWVLRLATACDAESQKSVAGKLGRSPALVNQVLKNLYKGDMKAVQRRVELIFGEDVSCPILGPITGGECLTWQNRKKCSANHQLVRMYLACTRCPLNICRKEKP